MLNFDHFLFLEVVMLSDTISNLISLLVTMTFNVIIKNTIVGWGICTLFWGPMLAGLLYKWMVPPCNLHLTEEKIKLPDKCLGECMLEIDWDIDNTIIYLNNFVSAKNSTSLYII